MKLVIASDIHGAADWCAKLMDAIERESPDRVVLLGDELYHGPRNDLPADYAPKRVIEMLNSIERMPELVEGDALLYGHTHIGVLSQMRGITIFNPGSVGIPKDGRHTYGIYDRGTFEHRNL